MFGDFEPVISSIKAVIRVQNNREKGQVAHYGSHLYSHELIYKCSGKSRTFFGGKEFIFERGVILYLPKGPINGSYYVETIEKGDAIDIYFDSAMPLLSEAQSIALADQPSVLELFEHIHKMWISSQPSRYMHCLSLFYKIIAEIKDYEFSSYIPPHQESVLRKGLDYLDLHCFDRDFDYGKLAEISGVSYSYFKRIFIKKIDMPPSRYITKKKMAYARSMLMNPSCSITELSELLGYNSIYYFSRVFKRENGMTPTQYRSSITSHKDS